MRSGSPKRCRCAHSSRHGGASVVQILGPRLPRAAATRSQGWRVDSRLPIFRTCFSRHHLCNKRALVTLVHGPPSIEGRALRGTSPEFRPARGPLSRPKSSARCSSSVCTCPTTWMTDSTNAEHDWTCMVSTDPLAHSSAC